MKLEELGPCSRRGVVLVRKQTRAVYASDWKRKTLALFLGDPRPRSPSDGGAAPGGGARVAALVAIADPYSGEVLSLIHI